MLTAIIVGLGGNASSSQRGSSLRDLIRKDRTVATITIYLANNFEENYLPVCPPDEPKPKLPTFG